MLDDRWRRSLKQVVIKTDASILLKTGDERDKERKSEKRNEV
jgi:hypothetical protein